MKLGQWKSCSYVKFYCNLRLYTLSMAICYFSNDSLLLSNDLQEYVDVVFKVNQMYAKVFTS